jgi:AcrR family transcriptional regulator
LAERSEERSKRKERAERILDAAAELVLRWGYRKTSVDDIAKQAGVAKGTIYLHWKTREELFLALLIRERTREGQHLQQEIARDPDGMTLHGLMKHATLAALRNPLLRAMMLQDSEMLGELAHSQYGVMGARRRIEAARGYLEILRDKGLVRSGMPLDTQVQMLTAISLSFIVLDQFLPEEYQSTSDEERAAMVEETVRRTFELRDPTPAEQRELAVVFNRMLTQAQEMNQPEGEMSS